MGLNYTPSLVPLDGRVTNLENHEYKVLYFAPVNTISGAVSIPAEGTLLQDDLQGATAIVETIIDGKPSGQSPVDALGDVVTVQSFDDSSFVLSGEPLEYPVAIIYVFKIKGKDYANVNLDNVIVYEKVLLADETAELAGISDTVASTPKGRETWWGVERPLVLDRTTHTGTQDISTVTGLQTALDGKIGNTADTFTSMAKVEQIVTLTQAEYNALTPNANTLYIIS
jgi:hypothetical protein